jgi:hypothetical protein
MWLKLVGLLISAVRFVGSYVDRLNRRDDRRAGADQQAVSSLTAGVKLRAKIDQAEANAPSDLRQLAEDLRKEGER